MLLALACALLAAAPPASPPPASAPAPHAAATTASSAFGATQKLRVVVMNLKLASVAPDFGQAVDGIITDALDNMGPFRAIGERDIGNMLDFEAKKQELGCTDEVSCLSEVAGAFGADYVVSGTLTDADGVFLLQLQLLDIAKASVTSRERRSTESKAALIDLAGTAAEALVRPLLVARSGALTVNVSEEGATIKIDRRAVGTSPLGVLTLPAGVHTVEVEKVGFIVASRDVSVDQQKPADVSFTLRPSEDYKKAYQQSALTMRIAAISSSAAGLASLAAGAGLFLFAGGQADAVRPLIVAYNADSVRTAAKRTEIDRRLSLIGGLDTGALVAGVGGVVAAGVGAGLFVFGGDPGRYEQP